MSKNGHEVTLKVVPGTSSNRNRQSGKRAESGAHVRLDGNIARRAVKPFEFFWWNTELPGFGLRTFPGGAKSWFVQFRQRGKQKRIVLGHPGEMNAREARSAARAELAKAALDGLPEAPKPRRKSAGAMTFKDYAPKFWEDYSRHWKPSTRKGNYGTIFGHLVEIFGHIRVDAIRKTDILQWRDSWADRTGTFNRSIPIMSGMMMYSEQLGLRPRGSNPCKGTPRFKCKLLERYLSAREFHRLAMALREFEVTGPIAVQAIQLLICTGARRRDRRVALGVGSTATAHAARQQDRSKDRLSQPAGSGGARYDSAAGTNRLRIPVAPRGQARRSRNPLEQHVSQPVFARYHNVSKNLVSDWERGKKRPGGPALRLLSIIQRKGLEAVA